MESNKYLAVVCADKTDWARNKYEAEALEWAKQKLLEVMEDIAKAVNEGESCLDPYFITGLRVPWYKFWQQKETTRYQRNALIKLLREHGFRVEGIFNNEVIGIWWQ